MKAKRGVLGGRILGSAFASVVAWCSGPSVQAAEVTLVRNNTAASVIVLEQGYSQPVGTVAEELREYLFRMTRVRPALTENPAQWPGMAPIYVGHTEAAARHDLGEELRLCKNDAFLIAVRDGAVHILGNNDLATMYGVYGFLKELGVRWYMPGELGQEIPRHATISWTQEDILREADFQIRWIGTGDWARRNGMNVAVSIAHADLGYDVFGSFHTYSTLLNPWEYFDDYPEYFAMVNGKRVWNKQSMSHGNQICSTNRDAAKECARNLDQMFRERPELDVVTLGPNDGRGFCECPDCMATREAAQPATGSLTRQIMLFNNMVARELARTHPNKLLKVGAYSRYTCPPLDLGLRVEPNIVVQFTRATSSRSCYAHSLQETRCQHNQIIRRYLKRWAEISSHLWIYEYYQKAAWIGFPWPIVHAIRDDIPFFKEIGVEGFYTQYSLDASFASHLDHYVAQQLLWDADADVDSILQDYYSNFYKEAARPMQQYWETLEASMTGDVVCTTGQAVARALKYFTPGVMSQCERFLSQAERVATNRMVQERLRLVRVQFEYTAMVMEYLRYFEGLLKAHPQLESMRADQVQRGYQLSDTIEEHIRAHSMLPIFTRNSNYYKRMLNPVFAFNRVKTVETIPFPLWGQQE